MKSPQKNQKQNYQYDPAIALQVIYLDKTVIQKDTGALIFIAALFTIAKTWKQPKCPSTDGLIKKTRYIDTMEYSVQFSRSVMSDSL